MKQSHPKLLDLLVAIGVSEEHIPKTTKRIDDLLTKKGLGDDGNDSSISEFDVRAEVAHLDEFEELFKIRAPIPAVDEKNGGNAADFKI